MLFHYLIYPMIKHELSHILPFFDSHSANFATSHHASRPMITVPVLKVLPLLPGPSPSRRPCRRCRKTRQDPFRVQSHFENGAMTWKILEQYVIYIIIYIVIYIYSINLWYIYIYCIDLYIDSRKNTKTEFCINESKGIFWYVKKGYLIIRINLPFPQLPLVPGFKWSNSSSATGTNMDGPGSRPWPLEELRQWKNVHFPWAKSVFFGYINWEELKYVLLKP